MELVSRNYNFSAGPSALPEPVLTQIRDELLNWEGTGASVMEVSHRSQEFIKMARNAEQDLRDLLSIPSTYKVLFLQGGGTLQFSQIPMNLMRDSGVCDYIDTGYWSRKAISAAGRYGKVNICASARVTDYTAIPREQDWQVAVNSSYLHYTSNETIDGLEFQWIPSVENDSPLVGDFSANILSGPLDVSKFGLIYAGAQKNIGPSGMTLVIVREDLLGGAHPLCPDVLNYEVLAEHNSMLNTPTTFAWYAAGLVFKWIKSIGGLEAMQARNVRKKNILYELIDSSDFYINDVVKEDRSCMNIPFRTTDEKLDGLFLEGAAEFGLLGLKGHRAKGGMRASLYNAVSEEAVRSLAGYMTDFRQRYG